MKSLPFTTKILLGILLIVTGRFIYTLISNPFSQSSTTTQKSVAAVDQILTCAEYKQKIQSCTSEAMVCLQQIAKSKKFHQQNQQKIIDCQNSNQRNLQLNQELRVKLDAVTERLDGLLKKRLPPKNEKPQPSSQL